MTFEKVAAALAEKAGMDVASIKPETTFAELNLDSLDTVDVLMGLEDIFNVHLEISPDMKCVADVVAQIEQLGA